MALSVEEIRAFIAIELEEGIERELARVQTLLKDKVAAPVRWTDPQGVHLTLKFLGNIPAERVEEIGSALREACQGFAPFTLQFYGLGCFPSLNSPRVIWIGIGGETETLKRLQERVEERLAPLGFPPEKRGFSPHLTLGRVKKYASSGALRKIGEAVAATEVGSLGQMEVREVSLIRSLLLPDGAQYSRLQVVALEGR